MKNSIKILLLIVSVIIAIEGVLIFSKTKMDPPSKLKLDDQYVTTLEDNCRSFEKIESFLKGSNQYTILDDKINRFSIEKAISDKTADMFKLRVNSTYSKLFSDYAYSTLKKSEWSQESIMIIRSWSGIFLSKRLTTGDYAINDKLRASFMELQSIIEDYDAARNLAANTSYRGVSEAASKIASANEYKNMDYLKNNSDLISELNELPGKLARSHYDYVVRMVDLLNKYPILSIDTYESEIVPKVNAALNEYVNTNIYGADKINSSDIEAKAKNAVITAMNYYNGN